MCGAIKMRSGIYFNLTNPRPEDIRLTDIAGALSKICRFGAQTSFFYSVAEHSINCKRQARREGLSTKLQLALLMHDATEAYIGDMVKPLKKLLPQYSEIEEKIKGAISKKFDVDLDAPEIKRIDRDVMFAERELMFNKDDVQWVDEELVKPVTICFFCNRHDEAERLFYIEAKQLWEGW